MFRTTTFAGIPMGSQRNRRALVIVTYLMLAIASVLLGVARGAKFQPIWIWILAFSGVSRGIFGSLVPQETLPPKRPEEPIDLGLVASGPRPEPPPDEREVWERNKAHFVAFRVVAVYSLFFFIAIALIQNQTSFVELWTLQVFAAILSVLVLTLPQAILLWSHPDLVEENG